MQWECIIFDIAAVSTKSRGSGHAFVSRKAQSSCIVQIFPATNVKSRTGLCAEAAKGGEPDCPVGLQVRNRPVVSFTLVLYTPTGARSGSHDRPGTPPVPRHIPVRRAASGPIRPNSGIPANDSAPCRRVSGYGSKGRERASGPPSKRTSCETILNAPREGTAVRHLSTSFVTNPSLMPVHSRGANALVRCYGYRSDPAAFLTCGGSLNTKRDHHHRNGATP